jgi:hypothetical protein
MLGLALATMVCAAPVNFRNVRLAERSDSGKARVTKGLLAVTGEQLRFEGKSRTVAVNVRDITGISYDQNNRFPFLPAPPFPFFIGLNGNRQLNYVTVQYREGEAIKYVVFQLDRGSYQEVIAALETSSGRKVERMVASR